MPPRLRNAIIVAAVAGLAVGAAIGVARARQTAPNADRAAPAAEGRPCHVPGVSDRALCHSIEVPEDWARPAGRKLRLHVAVLPSRGPSTGDSALFVLAGGPGQAAGDYGDLVDGPLDRVRERRPIVLMDARGTGRSGGMACAGLYAEDAALDPAAGLQALAQCRRTWGAAALQNYGTPEVVQDVEAVRRALGFRQLDLWGGSWGTRTALLYMRAHPAAVRSAVLDGVAPPDARFMLSESGYAQAALDQLLADCAADAGCNAAFPQLGPRLRAFFADPAPTRTLAVFDAESGERTEQNLRRDLLAQVIRGALYGAEGSSRLPYALDRMLKGDATPLTALARGQAALTRDSMFIGATLSALCGEELARTPAVEATRAGQRSFAGDSFYRLWSEACAGWPIKPPPADYARPVRSDAQVLLLSGGLDPITPPAAAEIARRGLSRAVHVVAPKTGHNVTNAPCADRVIAAFLKEPSETVDAKCLTTQVRPPFTVGPMGPKP